LEIFKLREVRCSPLSDASVQSNLLRFLSPKSSHLMAYGFYRRSTGLIRSYFSSSIFPTSLAVQEI